MLHHCQGGNLGNVVDHGLIKDGPQLLGFRITTSVLMELLRDHVEFSEHGMPL